jgi:hypothetical protein
LAQVSALTSPQPYAGAGNGCNVFGLSRTGRMDLKSIARAYLGLAAQDCSAWTQEMDLRPFAERI